MEELIFIALIIIFSVIDAFARSRKKKRAGPSGPTTQLPEEGEDDLPTYDAEPSYDDEYEETRQTRSRETISGYARRYGAGDTATADPTRSSEPMIPSDIWEEIAGLATGRPMEPDPSPEPEPVEVEQIPARPVATHRVHRSHVGYGTDPSTRARSEQDVIDPLRTPLSRDARAVRRQLRSHSKGQLRRAVILQEVLGPPVSDQPERYWP